MPLDCLHMTVLEITHSKSEAEIEGLVDIMKEKIPEIANFTTDHRARLVKPQLSYDAAAIALSFLPATWDSDGYTSDSYTYHHLRRDVYDLCCESGVEVASRYTVPSAHLTIARFVNQKDIIRSEGSTSGSDFDSAKICELLDALQENNRQLQLDMWSTEVPYNIRLAGQWTVGEEKGLDCRKGTLWYGGGQSLHVGRGFAL